MRTRIRTIQQVSCVLLLLNLLLVVHRVRAAPAAQLHLSISTPALPNGSPFELSAMVQDAPPGALVTIHAPESVRWTVIPAGCEPGPPVVCHPAQTWVGTLRGEAWDMPGVRLHFWAQMDGLKATATTELTAYELPPTPIPPATATPPPTATPLPSSTPTAIPLPTLAPAIPPTAIPPPASEPVEVPVAIEPTPFSMPSPAQQTEPLAGVRIEEIPIAQAAQPTSIPTILVPVNAVACYDRNQNAACDIDEGIAGITVYVTDERSGAMLAQALTDQSGRAAMTVRVPETSSLVLSMPSFAATQRFPAKNPLTKSIMVSTVAPLPALLP